MLSDFNWLAAEAKQIHGLFENLFYSVVGTLLILGIVLEYFKFSVGSVPSFVTLVGRSFVAAMLLVSFPEVLNAIAGITDAFAEEIGSLNKVEHVLSRMGDQVDKLTWSWTSVKKMALVFISFVSFFLLYISVYLTNALYVFTWTILYVLSPILIAFYVLPATSGITKNLYRSLFLVASWKITWCVLAALLWSAALIDLEKLSNDANFLTICIFNIMLAVSLLLTPFIANSFLSSGLANITPKVGAGAVGVMGAGLKHILKFTKNRIQEKSPLSQNSFNRSFRSPKRNSLKSAQKSRLQNRRLQEKNKPTPRRFR